MNSLASIFYFSVLTLFAGNSRPADFGKGDVVLTCNVTACEKVDSIYLFEFNGINFKKIQTAPTENWQTYKFKVTATGPRFYYVGLGGDNLRPIILGTEDKVDVNGTCPSFKGASISGIGLNHAYEAVNNELDQHKNELGNYMRQLQSAEAQNNVDLANTIIGYLAKLDKKRMNLLDSLKRTNPYLAKVAAINTYLSYQNYGTGDETEIEYFANKFFQFTDWKDPDYNYMPWVFEGIKGYTQTLASVRLPDAVMKQFADKLLGQIPENSRAYMLALGGVIAGLQSKNNANLSSYAKRFVEKYEKTEPEAVARIQVMLQNSASFISGNEAPNFTMNSPEGKPVSLKDFRGKVLLVDFWASWCGPCRQENPNVVKLYNKYQSKGFEILGVSLDRSKDPWLAAIQKDGLIWHHVSDLKSWQNEAAKLYGVTSIPHTVLLDKEGRILARNLRGATLAAKLQEIFGE